MFYQRVNRGPGALRGLIWVVSGFISTVVLFLDLSVGLPPNISSAGWWLNQLRLVVSLPCSASTCRRTRLR